jgi:hypothetical protein
MSRKKVKNTPAMHANEQGQLQLACVYHESNQPWTLQMPLEPMTSKSAPWCISGGRQDRRNTYDIGALTTTAPVTRLSVTKHGICQRDPCKLNLAEK